MLGTLVPTCSTVWDSLPLELSCLEKANMLVPFPSGTRVPGLRHTMPPPGVDPLAWCCSLVAPTLKVREHCAVHPHPCALMLGTVSHLLASAQPVVSLSCDVLSRLGLCKRLAFRWPLRNGKAVADDFFTQCPTPVVLRSFHS